MSSADRYEKLGVFYLGRPVSAATGEVEHEPFLYDSRDLTTHAFCVGMTGSGKTGLCVALLEEAALDGIPALAIDPKGDLGNLLLTFPALRAADFRPWIDESGATRNGRTPDEEAAHVAETWRRGLEDFDQDGDRIARFRSAVDVALYTPGSRVGLPLRVLGSLDAPPAAVREDPDALRDRVVGTVSGLLTLLGVDADPVQSREHIVLSRVLLESWEHGRSLDLGSLIRALQTPPFDRIGVIDLESYFPAEDRFELATRLNNLLASPGFEAWREGAPLDVGRLLYTEEGKPRLSILSIAHLSERERMFFVTLLLGEVVSWMRAQEGTSSLRALLFMDEVFGYFPPLGNPPAKPLMLTLLKQARAYGLGIVLATQNPVDIDYKGLSNCGTWFLGRLQTERDKARVLDGLQGAAGGAFDRAQVDRLLSGLGKRIFLMNDVHEDGPALFQTRWTLSYLRGPLQRDEIRRLTAESGRRPPESDGDREQPPPRAEPGEPTETAGTGSAATIERPFLPAEAREAFLAVGSSGAPKATRLRPGLLAQATLHYALARADLDHWVTIDVFTPLEPDLRGSPWGKHTEELAPDSVSLTPEPSEPAPFAETPAAVSNPKSYPRWSQLLRTHLHRERPLVLRHCPELRTYSRPGETEGEFHARLDQRRRELRDQERTALDERFRARLARFEEQRRRAEARGRREQEQYENRRMETVLSFGSTLLGAVLGRRMGGLGTARGAASAAKGLSRTARERGDVERAAEEVAAIEGRIRELDREYRDELRRLAEDAARALPLEEVAVRARKTDLGIASIRFVWRS